MEGQALDIQDGGREPGIPRPGPRQARREQAGQEHSGLLATRAEAAAVAAGPERSVGRRCSGGRGQGRLGPMSASPPW